MLTPPNTLPSANSRLRVPTRAEAAKIAITYALAGCLWILCSDWLLYFFISNPRLAHYAEVGKGWFYVLTTATILGLALDRYFATIRESTGRLQEGELRMSLALDAADLGLWDHDLTTGRLVWNPKEEALWGFAPGTFPGTFDAILRQVHPEDRAQLRHAIDQAQQDRAAFRHEFRAMWPDGSEHWLTSRGRHLYDAQDHPVRLIGVTIEITKRKHAELARSESDQRQRALLDNIPDPAWMRDLDGRYLAVNKAWCLFMGWPATQALGRKDIEIYPPDLAREIQDQEQAVIRSRSPQRWEETIPDHAGVAKTFETIKAPVFDEAGQVTATIGIARDVTERKRAEHRLRQLSRTVEQCPVSIIITDTQGAIEYVNPKFTAATGYTLEEALGRNPRILKSNAMSPDHYRGLWEAISSGREWRGELHNRKKSGELFWEMASISPITNAEGTITHYVAVLEDITEAKKHEAFRQALLSLGACLTNSRDPISAGRALLETADRLWAWDAATLKVFAPGSPLVQTILLVDTIAGRRQELSGAETTGMTARTQRVITEGAELTLRDDPNAAEPDWVPFGDRSRRSASIMTVPLRRDNQATGILSIQSYSIRAYTSEDLKTLQALGDYCGGALDRLRSEKALGQSEERFRTLVENAPIGIFLQANLRFFYVNRAAALLFGAGAPDQLLDRPVLERFHDSSHPFVKERIKQVNVERQAVGLKEERCVRLDGTVFTGEFQAVPFNCAGVPGALVFFQDVSQRRSLEAQLRQAQKLDGIGQLAGGVAHDFNNILAAMMLHLGLLRMNPDLDPETASALRELEAEARRAAALTRQLLMFSRRSVLDVKALDMNAVITDLLTLLNRLIGEHVRIRFDGLSNLPLVQADAGMMEQVLMNLVVNARDAMPQGGRITIATSVITLDAKNIPSHEDRAPGAYVSIAVSDTGCGMDEAILKRVFEPFFTTKEPGKGTGLGLATVHGIVAQHRGWVDVTSEVGKGSTFRAQLPVLTTSPGAQRASLDSAITQGGRETILLVEDDPAVRLAVARSLRNLGYRIYEAENGKEAMVRWQEVGGTVDLLFTDMVMPEGTTGLELVQQLRALRPSLKAIISSGYSAEMVHSGRPTEPGIRYLPKPFETPALAAAIRACLDLDSLPHKT